MKPGDRVVDLGCGSGVLGLLCLEAGAGHVAAIDETDMIEVARLSLQAAGFGPRSTFLRGRCEETILPQPADLAIADHVGYFGIDYGVVGLFQDARRRLLRPAGRVLPSRLRLEAALVESAEAQALAEARQEGALPPAYAWLRKLTSNTVHPVEFRPQDLLGDAVALGDIDLAAEDRSYFSWTVEMVTARDGEAHGVAGWFEALLCEGVSMTNSPLAPDRIRRPQAFFPLGDPLPVRAGDTMRVTVLARPAENLLAWRVKAADGREIRRSNWEAMPMPAKDIAGGYAGHRPSLHAFGRAQLALLSLCDGTRTRAQVESEFLRGHGGLFASPEAAARFVARVLDRHTP